MRGRVRLGQLLDVLEDTLVDLMDDIVRPERPVGRRPHVMLVPGRAFEARAAVGELDQAEPAALRNEEAVQVRRLDVAEWVEFLHGWRVVRHIELQ